MQKKTAPPQKWGHAPEYLQCLATGPIPDTVTHLGNRIINGFTDRAFLRQISLPVACHQISETMRLHSECRLGSIFRGTGFDINARVLKTQTRKINLYRYASAFIFATKGPASRQAQQVFFSLPIIPT